MAQKLTGKQEKFAQGVAQGKSLTQAYIDAGYSGEVGSENTHRLAVGVSQNIKVSSRVEELKQEARKRHEVTVDTIREMYLEAYKAAQVENSRTGQAQASAMADAAKKLADLYGLEAPKKQDLTSGGQPLSQTIQLKWAEPEDDDGTEA